MVAFNKVFALGLPRCGGQSLQRALWWLTGRDVWHSIRRDLWYLIQPENLGAVEVHVSIDFLERTFPGSVYILNTRDCESWLHSCSSVYERARHWTHPLWTYPIEDFAKYRDSYLRERREWLRSLSPERYLILDMKDFSWQPLRDFLHLPSSAIPFPNEDKWRDESEDYEYC